MHARDMSLGAKKERGNRFEKDVVVLGIAACKAIEDFFRLFTYLTEEEGKFRDDFRIAIRREIKTQRTSYNKYNTMIHAWCLNPAVTFRVSFHVLIID